MEITIRDEHGNQKTFWRREIGELSVIREGGWDGPMLCWGQPYQGNTVTCTQENFRETCLEWLRDRGWETMHVAGEADPVPPKEEFSAEKAMRGWR